MEMRTAMADDGSDATASLDTPAPRQRTAVDWTVDLPTSPNRKIRFEREEHSVSKSP